MNLDTLTTDQLRDRVEKAFIEHIKLCQDNFLYFVQAVWPDFICRKAKEREQWGHHQHIADELTSIARGSKGRLIVNMPPRHTKSEFASFLAPKDCCVRKKTHTTAIKNEKCCPTRTVRSTKRDSKKIKTYLRSNLRIQPSTNNHGTHRTSPNNESSTRRN